MCLLGVCVGGGDELNDCATGLKGKIASGERLEGRNGTLHNSVRQFQTKKRKGKEAI